MADIQGGGIDIQKGVNQLQGFGSVLGSVLGTLGTGFDDLKISFEISQKQINELREALEAHGIGIKKIKSNQKSDELSSAIVEPLLSTITADPHLSTTTDEPNLSSTITRTPSSELGSHIVAQVFAATGDLHVELDSLRTVMKTELVATQNALTQLITESMANLSKGKDESLPEITSDSTTADVMEIILQRLGNLENRMNAQQAVNASMQQALQADYQVQDHFDSLTAQVTVLERTLSNQRRIQASLEAAVENCNGIIQQHERLIVGIDTRLREGGRGTRSSFNWGEGNSNISLRDDTNLTTEDVEHGKRVQAERSLAALQSDTASALKRNAADIASLSLLADTLQQRVAALETQLSTTVIRRIDGTNESITDLSKGVEELRSAVTQFKLQMDAMHEQTGIMRGKSSAGARNYSIINMNSDEVIADAKQMWRRLLADLNIGLDNLHVTGSDGTGNTDKLVPGIASFRVLLLSTLPAFEPLDNPEATLDALYPKLDRLTTEATTLIELDRDARQPESLGVTFDDLMCADRTYHLADHINAVCDFSSRILDLRVQKVQLKRRLDLVEQKLRAKSDIVDLIDLEREMRGLVAAKADVRDVEGILGKKASVAELQQFREMIFHQLEDLRVSGYPAIPGAGGTRRLTDGPEDTGKDPERDELVKRFELLYRQFQDLMAHCVSFVPREEIEAALHTVLTEVKSIKTTYVDTTTLREKLRKKADNTDLERLLGLLSANLAESERTASALHAKCLVCDKPVHALNVQVLTSKSVSNLPAVDSSVTLPPSPTVLYEKPKDRGGTSGGEKDKDKDSKERPVTTARKDKKRGTSAAFNVSAEVSILKSSVDLPPLGDTTTFSGNAMSSSAPQFKQYKQRLRASAGGGAGPAYAVDTR